MSLTVPAEMICVTSRSTICPGPRFGGLLGDGDAFAGFDEPADVALCRVMRHAAHGHAVAFGERDADQWRRDVGVLLEDLVEISEAEKQDDVVREALSGWRCTVSSLASCGDG